MPWTLTRWLTDNYITHPGTFGVEYLYHRTAPGAAPTGWVVDWFAHIRDNFLAGVPSPNRVGTLQVFQQAAQTTLRNHLTIGTPTGGIIAALDLNAQQHLDNVEAGLIAGAPAPAPILVNDAEYLTPGVMCTGTPVDLHGNSVPLWTGRDAYSGNHGRAANFAYLGGGGPAPLVLAFAVPANNSAMIARVKPNRALLALLGDSRHAEDGWMARFYSDFVTAVNALQPPAALPALAGRSLWQQKATVPRVEFLLSMSPCQPNDGNPQEGCRRYFAEMRAALTTANVPILIYYYRVWEAAQQTRGVQSVAANGDIVNYPNRW